MVKPLFIHRKFINQTFTFTKIDIYAAMDAVWGFQESSGDKEAR